MITSTEALEKAIKSIGVANDTTYTNSIRQMRAEIAKAWVMIAREIREAESELQRAMKTKV